MLLVIFGAGASHDALPTFPAAGGVEPNRVPLSNQLFDLAFDDYFRWIARRASPLLTYLRNPIDASVEEWLEEFQAESASDPERIHQLMAIRYYLQILLMNTGILANERSGGNGDQSGTTNYLTLLDELRRLIPAEEPVLLVTFNYDRLLDIAVQAMGQKITSMNSYVADRFRLFKVHGSVDWGRRIEPINPIPVWVKTGQDRTQFIIDTAPDRIPMPVYYRDGSVPVSGTEEAPAIPAIAIPLQRKQAFELPAEHLDALRALLPQVDTIVTIGWRAADEPFLALLKEHLTVPARGVVVAPNDPRAIIRRIVVDAGLRVDLTPFTAGFTQFMKQRGIVKLLEGQRVILE